MSRASDGKQLNSEMQLGMVSKSLRRMIEPADAIKFLREASKYFQTLAARTPEDSVYWANVHNAEMCGQCSDLIEAQLVEPS